MGMDFKYDDPIGGFTNHFDLMEGTLTAGPLQIALGNTMLVDNVGACLLAMRQYVDKVMEIMESTTSPTQLATKSLSRMKAFSADGKRRRVRHKESPVASCSLKYSCYCCT